MRCEIYHATDALGQDAHQCHRDAVRECHDCGKKLCREDANLCCDIVWCEGCLEFHQTDDHPPLEELIAA